MKSFYEKYWENVKEAPPEKDPLTPKRIKFFLEFIKNKNIKDILDFGCGSGFASNEFSKAGYNVVGFDISQNAVDEAKKRYPNINFLSVSLENKLPFYDEKFDAIYCVEVIEHIYDTEGTIKEMARILRKNGLLFLSTPYHGFWKNLILTLFKFEKHFNPVGPHIRFFTKNSLVKPLKQNGFIIEKTIYLGRFFPIWMDMVVIAKKPY